MQRCSDAIRFMDAVYSFCTWLCGSADSDFWSCVHSCKEVVESNCKLVETKLVCEFEVKRGEPGK